MDTGARSCTLLAVMFAVSACGRIDYDPANGHGDADASVSDDLGSVDANRDDAESLPDVGVDALLDVGTDATVDGSADADDMFVVRTPGISVAPTTALMTTEAGGTDNFSIVLTDAPSAPVTIDVTSSNLAEGTVFPATITFSTLNWNAPQLLTVTGVDDAELDGNAIYTVLTAPATSADGAYDGLNADDVSVTNIDNESPGVTVTPTSGLVTGENGRSDSFTIVLNAAPIADVSIALSSSAPSEALPTSPSVTFTVGDWDAPQTVSVSGVDDVVRDGDASFTIVTGATASADPNYDALDTADVTGTNLDDESPGIVVSASTLETTEAGGADTFTVELQSRPSANVVIPIVSSDVAEGAVSPASITITPATWDVPRTITVTGVDDSVADGNQPYDISIGPTTSTDPDYDGLSSASVPGTNEDDDSVGIDFAPTTPVVTTEGGGTATLSVVLTSRPTASVTLTFASDDLTEATISPPSITFTTANWNVPRNLTVTGVDDSATDGDQAYDVTMHVSASGDSAYAAVPDATLTLTNIDDDIPGVIITPTSGLSATEDGSTYSEFTVSLRVAPTDDVYVSFRMADPTQGWVDSSVLVFTPSDWNTPQTNYAGANQEGIVDGDVLTTIVTDEVESDDLRYNGLDPDDITITMIDSDMFGVEVSPTTGLVTDEDGGSINFFIWLTAQPAADVTVSITSSNVAEGTTDVSSVVFTHADWGARNVTITGVNDGVIDGDVPYTIVTGNAVSTDPAYSGMVLPDVSVTNLASTMLITDCTHRWLAEAAYIDTNTKYFAANTGFVVAGIVGGVGARINMYSELTGAPSWTRMGEGAFNASVQGDVGMFVNSGGGGSDVRSLNLVAGTSLSYVTYGFPLPSYGPAGFAMRSTGESLVAMFADPHDAMYMPIATWSFTLAGPGMLSGPGPATVLLRHALGGAYIAHSQVTGSLRRAEVFSHNDGRWTIVVVNGSSASSYGAHAIPASRHELLTIGSDLSFDRAFTLPDTSYEYTPVSVDASTNVRYVAAEGGLQAYSDAGLLWERTDCTTTPSITTRLQATPSAVYFTELLGPGASFCGRRVPAGPGGYAIATLDPATGATLSTRFVPNGNGSWGLFISADGDMYIALYGDGVSPQSICGVPFPLPGSPRIIVFAL